MNIQEWRDRLIAYFKSGKATDSHWDELSILILYASEEGNLSDELEAAINPDFDKAGE